MEFSITSGVLVGNISRELITGPIQSSGNQSKEGLHPDPAEMQIIHFSSPHFFIENQMVLGWKDGDGVPGGAANQQNAKVHRFSKKIY